MARSKPGIGHSLLPGASLLARAGPRQARALHLVRQLVVDVDDLCLQLIGLDHQRGRSAARVVPERRDVGLRRRVVALHLLLEPSELVLDVNTRGLNRLRKPSISNLVELLHDLALRRGERVGDQVELDEGELVQAIGGEALNAVIEELHLLLSFCLARVHQDLAVDELPLMLVDLPFAIDELLVLVLEVPAELVDGVGGLDERVVVALDARDDALHGHADVLRKLVVPLFDLCRVELEGHDFGVELLDLFPHLDVVPDL